MVNIEFSAKQEWQGLLNSTFAFGGLIKNYSSLASIWSQTVGATTAQISKGIAAAFTSTSSSVIMRGGKKVLGPIGVAFAFKDAFDATTWALRYIGGENKNIDTMITTLIDNLERGIERKPEAKAFNEKVSSIQLALSYGNYAIKTDLAPILSKIPPPIGIDNPEEHVPYVTAITKATKVLTQVIDACTTLQSKQFKQEYDSFNKLESYIPLTTNIDHIIYHAERVKEKCEELSKNAVKYCASLNAVASSITNLESNQTLKSLVEEPLPELPKTSEIYYEFKKVAKFLRYIS